MHSLNRGGGAHTGPTVCGGRRARLMHWRLSIVGVRSTELDAYMTFPASILARTQIQPFAICCNMTQKPESRVPLVSGEFDRATALRRFGTCQFDPAVAAKRRR